MRMTVFSAPDCKTVQEVVDRVSAAAKEGFDGFWVAQGFGFDSITALAVAAREVPGIHLGTAVVPIQGRHPVPLAQQALTLADAAGPGRVTLGVGVTHAPASEGVYGISYRDTVRLCAEELEALAPLLSADRKADVTGTFLTARITIGVATPPPGLVLAALGPKMLALAGRHTDGTVTWMTGPRTLRDDVVPRLREAASGAGRPAPRVIVGIPVCVTDDVAGARERLGGAMAGAASMASYKRMVAAEGVKEPVDIALIGDEDAVRKGIDELEEVGGTEVLANVQGTDEEKARTRAFLAKLSR
jgi:F420-dependent oxidoreductase-like protein